MTGQYRVLTPTMYRSRMATARQAVSMDCGGDEKDARAPKRDSSGGRGGSASPLARPRPLKKTQDSLELELGASATRVWRQQESVEKAKFQQQQQQQQQHYSKSSSSGNRSAGEKSLRLIHYEVWM